MNVKSHPTRVQLVSGFVLAVALSPAPLVLAGENSWISGNGNWEDASNWSLSALPVSGDNVWLAGSGYAVNKQSSSPLLGDVSLVGDSISLNLYHSSLNVKNLLIGDDKASYLNQIDNSTTAISETLTLGQQQGAYGQYIVGQVYEDSNGAWQIVNGGTLEVKNAVIGNSGQGHFHQLTGATTIAEALTIAQQSGTNGWFGLGYISHEDGEIHNVDGGTLDVTDVIVGDEGNGEFHQQNGTTTIAGTLTVGKESGSVGWVRLGRVYDDSDGVSHSISGGKLTASNVLVGEGGDGYYHQMNGTTSISNDLTIASQGGSEGTVHMEGGVLTAGGISVGVAGKGDFLQTAGSVTTGALNISGDSEVSIFGGTMEVANHLISEGLFVLTDTSQLLVHGNEMIGMASQSASLTQSGSSMNTIIQDLLIGANGGTGTYTLNSGTFAVGGRGYIGLNGGTGSFMQSGGSSDVQGHLDIGTGGTGTYALSGDSSQLHVADYMVLGYAGGTGIFSQAGGITTVNGLIVGGQKNATGIYNLSGESSQLVSNDFMAVGWSGGEGEFIHSEGTTTANNGLIIGGDNGEGSYKLGGVKSKLIVSNFEGIGMNAGTGSFDQNGGTHTTASLAIGNGLNSHGTYNLNGASSQLNVTGSERIGVNGGTGVFTQSGGTNTVANELIIGFGGIGTYNLSGTNSQLTVNSLQAIGSNGGIGVFNQTGGINSIKNNTLYVGGSGNGTYNLSGNSSQLLASQNEIIGYTGSGVFNQNGGTHTVGDTLTISATPGTSSGTYNLSDGTLNVAGTIINNDTLNYSGGIFNASLINNRTFALSGSGTRIVNGDVTNNGTITTTDTTIQFIGTFTNNGAYISDPSTQYFENLVIGKDGYLQGGVGDKWVIAGDLTIDSESDLWDTALADLEFSGTGEHIFDFSGSQEWNSLTLDTGAELVFSTDSASIRVDVISGLTFNDQGFITNIGGAEGLAIYYDPLNLENQYLMGQTFHIEGGGSLEAQPAAPVPVPSALLLLSSGIACLAAGTRRRS